MKNIKGKINGYNMNDFYDIRGYKTFKREAHKLLIETLSDFLE